MKYKNDKDLGLVLCMHCMKVLESKQKVCPKCNSKLKQRDEYSYLKTLSFSLVAIIFLFPANLLPMMEVTTLGVVEKSTIFDGILYFFQTKSYFIAIVIFIASIAVPIFKLAVLLYLLYVTRYNKISLAKNATKYYRIIKFIGKWSMLDIFVVALMIVMVQFGNLTNISAGLAAIAFTVVVISTMLATQSFDTRLLWDKD
ncbi:paraquat-inducible protein A [Malaciobacter marinus]|uniref:Paraquat-inducible protein A n=1 Tax=Malaciobacter marinus TaxID=505249 RepID=A0A347TLT9_9BACT|nr:paraquat-inducible protein A [Malaciobacter marinus]AXX87567.1 paraquat-inducible protein A [Malaciobacter marinus]PHO12012.1 paraquat-inducible protein A [Malaciobacter marinus]PHO14468.1 paraquat-inducible protein A [Malaciobacter marinus]